MKIKPCPFCGHTPNIECVLPIGTGENVHHGKPMIFFIECKNNECPIQKVTANSFLNKNAKKSYKELITRWNTRALE